MNVEKVKRKMAEGHKDEELAAMSGMAVEEVAKLRNSDLPKTGGTSTSKASPTPKTASKAVKKSSKKK
jgi:hypothetical protein